jgi:hypothetical protein
MDEEPSLTGIFTFIAGKWFNGSNTKIIFIFDPIWQNYFFMGDASV